MARGVVFEVQGMRGFQAALEKASVAVQQRVGEANRQTAYAIQRAAQRNLAGHRDRGDLIANIGVVGRGFNWRVGIFDTSIPSRGGTNTAHLNPWVYGQFLEFGFKSFRELRFMRNAVDAQAGPHETRVQEAGLKLSTDLQQVA